MSYAPHGSGGPYNYQSQAEPYSHYPQQSDYDNRDYQISPVGADYASPPARDHNISPPQPPSHSAHPSLHPSSSFRKLQAQRQSGGSAVQFGSGDAHSQSRAFSPPRKPVPVVAPQPQAPPQVPAHGIPRQPVQQRQSTTSPGQDNLGPAAAGGGVTGLALGVAHSNERESGLQAAHGIGDWGRGSGAISGPSEPRLVSTGHSTPYSYDEGYGRHNIPSTSSYSSGDPFAGAASAPGYAVPSPNHSNASLHTNGGGYGRPFGESSYDNHTMRRPLGPGMGMIDPMSIADEGDDEMKIHQDPKRRSWVNLGRSTPKTGSAPSTSAGLVAGGAAGGGLATFGNRDASGQYGPVPTGAVAGNEFEGPEKRDDSEWLSKQTTGSRKLRWIVGIILVLLIIGAIAGGVAGGLLSKSNDKSGSKGQTAAEDDSKGDLNKDSTEIKALLNNPNLHRVFPGVDYTPLNAQYPDCLGDPPSQNNVTRDMAVLGQMTNKIRLYGTDCNQTEMVIHAIDRLALTDMKLWLGVWLGDNSTTNDRQLSQMWSLLDKHGASPFEGVVVGNEVLFRKDMTNTELAKVLGNVRSNLTSSNIDLPLATSDLGDNWTTELASEVDVIMSNIHPFFGGVTAALAASWTWSFWQNKDVALTQALTGKKHVISEVGWPSEGGNDCASTEICPDKTSGAVASVDNMNLFMSDWVCQALSNGTNYFWFEAFDEPWKERYNEPDKNKNWEDKWGLMDVSRNLKKGVKIPDCDGKTV